MKISRMPAVWSAVLLTCACDSQPDPTPERTAVTVLPAKPSAPAVSIASAAPSASAVAPPANPVQAEMRVLHEATRDWVTAIANDQLEQIPPGIRRVHSARLETEKAVKGGKYRPPVNGDQLEQFEKTDEAFHDELVKLVKAAKADDLPAATKQLGVVLEGCTSCHQKFRFPAKAK